MTSDLTNYVHPDNGLNYTMTETEKLMALLAKHGIPTKGGAVELAPIKDATTQDLRGVSFEQAQSVGIKPDDFVYITFYIGENQTTAGYLARLVKMHGLEAMVKRLYLEHVGTEQDWKEHLLSLDSVRKAIKKEFT